MLIVKSRIRCFPRRSKCGVEKSKNVSFFEYTIHKKRETNNNNTIHNMKFLRHLFFIVKVDGTCRSVFLFISDYLIISLNYQNMILYIQITHITKNFGWCFITNLSINFCKSDIYRFLFRRYNFPEMTQNEFNYDRLILNALICILMMF